MEHNTQIYSISGKEILSFLYKMNNCQMSPTVEQEKAVHTQQNAMQTNGEEVANALTHGLGFGLSSAGIALLVVASIQRGDSWHVVSTAIFGASLVILYGTSTIYHAISHPGAKRILRLLDHMSIYILIAGSYTAMTLTILRGPLGWTLFSIEWAIAVLGITFKSIFQHRWEGVSTAGYVIMGWMILIAIYAIFTKFPLGGIVWLVLGGLSYTGGVGFFLQDEKKRYYHAIWHMFVLTGSVCHFFMVLWYIIPSK